MRLEGDHEWGEQATVWKQAAWFSAKVNYTGDIFLETSNLEQYSP
jgi:hypothetical protein